MLIKTKEQMYRLLLAGRFGNYPRVWTSLEEVMASDYQGEVSIRCRDISNPTKLYHIPKLELPYRLSQIPDKQQRAGFTFTESPSDENRLIQGEYDGYSFTYSFAPYPMRVAFMYQCLHADGAEARWLLKHYMTATDYEWLFQLLDDFPGCVVEFSVFRVRLGTSNERTIFWEVRHY